MDPLTFQGTVWSQWNEHEIARTDCVLWVQMWKLHSPAWEGFLSQWLYFHPLVTRMNFMLSKCNLCFNLKLGSSDWGLNEWHTHYHHHHKCHSISLKSKKWRWWDPGSESESVSLQTGISPTMQPWPQRGSNTSFTPDADANSCRTEPISFQWNFTFSVTGCRENTDSSPRNIPVHKKTKQKTKILAKGESCADTVTTTHD